MSGRAGLGLVLLAAGALWLLSATDVVDLSYRLTVGILLVLVGVVMVVTPGRHALLTVVGVVVLLAGIPALFVEPGLWTEGVGDETATPATQADLVPLEHGIGKLTVDLRAPDLPLDGKTVEASLGIGELLVLVPEDTDVTVDAHAGVGRIEALGREESGLDVDLERISGTSGSQELDLDLEVGIGSIRVELPG